MEIAWLFLTPPAHIEYSHTCNLIRVEYTRNMATCPPLTDWFAHIDCRLHPEVPKLVSSTGACAASLPVPISLKGLGHTLLASRDGTKRDGTTRVHTDWVSVPWERKRRRGVWRGAHRTYSECLTPTSQEGQGCVLRTCATRCYRSGASHAAGLMAELTQRECPQCVCPDAVPPHPRALAVRLGGDDALPLDTSYSLCSKARGGCELAARRAALQTARQRRLEGMPFSALANFSAVLELDGFGWQVGTVKGSVKDTVNGTVNGAVKGQ